MQLIGVGMGRLLYMEMLDSSHFKTLVARRLISDQDSKKTLQDPTSSERRLILKVIGCEVLICLAYFASKDVFGAPSRRLCNLPYILYQVALINSYTCYLLIIDRLLVTRHTNMVDNAINYGQLQFFVWSNLLTGLINVVVKTYYQALGISLAIMIAYFITSVVITNQCKKFHCCKRVF